MKDRQVVGLGEWCYIKGGVDAALKKMVLEVNWFKHTLRDMGQYQRLGEHSMRN
jgi:hypothetical protein